MNVAKQIRTIQSLESRYVKLQKEIQGRVRKITRPVERHIKKRLREEFPKKTFDFLTSFQCGCLTDRWEPQVFLYTINGLACSPEGYWYDEEHNQELVKRNPPVPVRSLVIFLKLLSNEVGVKIKLVKRHPYWLEQPVLEMVAN